MKDIVLQKIRIPRMLMALLSGASLSLAGLLMQTLFRNPLAGPYVLGINSGASLFVALSIMTGIPFFTTDLSLVSGALIGAFLFGMLVLFFAKIVKNQISLLLIGLMLGSFTSAIVAFIQSVSPSEDLKIFTLWGLGSLQKVNIEQIPYIFMFIWIGITSALLIIKSLNAIVLGEQHAKLLGINVSNTRFIIILITAVLTGITTAFCGPISFVGLAVPNLTRILFKTQQHKILIPGTLLIGGIFILFCDIIIKLLENHFIIPINVLTSLIGAPMVIWLVLKRLK